jgi:hypothetical protein
MPFLIRPSRRFPAQCAAPRGAVPYTAAGLQFGWWGKLHERLSRLVS